MVSSCLGIYDEAVNVEATMKSAAKDGEISEEEKSNIERLLLRLIWMPTRQLDCKERQRKANLRSNLTF